MVLTYTKMEMAGAVFGLWLRHLREFSYPYALFLVLAFCASWKRFIGTAIVITLWSGVITCAKARYNRTHRCRVCSGEIDINADAHGNRHD